MVIFSYCSTSYFFYETHLRGVKKLIAQALGSKDYPRYEIYGRAINHVITYAWGIFRGGGFYWRDVMVRTAG